MVDHVTWALAAALLCLVAASSSSMVSVRSLHMQSHIKYRFATTLVTSSMFNDDPKRSHEALFEVNLPEEAFISNFSMTVDGEVYPGRVEEKKKALKAYHDAKKRGESAGYIKTTARHSNKFDVSVNLHPGSEVTFNLTYQQVLVRYHGMYEHKMHVDPGRAVRDMKIEVFIEEARNITKLDTGLKKELNDVPLETDIVVETPDDRSRYIVYTPPEKQRGAKDDEFSSGEFLVKYDVERTSPAGEVLVVDGYFLHFFAPENSGDAPPVPKDIVFVLDVSGSMSGAKIRQLKDAMRTILNELSSKDTFNIVTFNDRLRWWKDGLVPVNSDTIAQSMQYVQALYADDGTDINLAMTSGVQFLLDNRDRTHTSIVFFLTDGEPTVGVRDPGTIANNVDRNNEHVASVFGLAFGERADYNLVKIIAAQNDGFARRIYEASDASRQVEGFYDEISSTMMLNLSISYMNSSVQLDTLTPTFFKNVFQGNDIVVAGKVEPGLSETNVISGMITAEKTDGPLICRIIEDNLTTFLGPAPLTNPYFELPVSFSAVTERSWAYLSIKQLLKRKKKETYKKVKDSDVDEKILELSLKYNFVTPLTSMVATKPEEKASQASVRGDDYAQDTKTSRKTYHRNSQSNQPQPMDVMALRPSRSQFQPSRQLYFSNSYQARGGGSLSPGSLFGRGVMSRPSVPMYPHPQISAIRRPQVKPTQPPKVSSKWGRKGTSKRVNSGRARRKYKKTRKGKHANRKCFKGTVHQVTRTLLDGFGIEIDNKTSCVKVKQMVPGSYILYPDKTSLTNSSIFVNVTVSGSIQKPSLESISVALSGRTYLISIDPHNTTPSNITETEPFLFIHKHVTCKRRTARLFLVLRPQDAVDGRNKRDVKRRILKKSYRGRRKHQLFRVCNGRPQRENFSGTSSRYTKTSSAKNLSYDFQLKI